MDIKDRIIFLAKSKDLPIYRFETKCGLSNGYLKNSKGKISLEKLEGILKAFPDINSDWLLFGEGEMLKSENPASVSATGNGIAVNNSNCKISRVANGNNANGTLDSLQAEIVVLRNENTELRAALLDLTRQNQKLTDKLLEMIGGTQ